MADSQRSIISKAVAELRNHAWLERFRKADYLEFKSYSKLSPPACNDIAGYVDKFLDLVSGVISTAPQLWIVGRNRPDNPSWEFMGVYDSEQDAVAACLDATFFVGPAIVNETLPLERVTWPGCYFPKSNVEVVPD